MDLIYQHKKDSQDFGSIWQCGYREIPWNLQDANIDLVIFAAAECPPLNHFSGAQLEYCPNYDSLCVKGTEKYGKLLRNALVAVPLVVDAVRKGKNVLSTCAAGMNRSGIITALSMKRLTSLDPEEIIKIVQQKRKIGALTNPSFNEMILEN